MAKPAPALGPLLPVDGDWDEARLKALKRLINLLFPPLTDALDRHTFAACSCLISLLSIASATVLRKHTEHVVREAARRLNLPETRASSALKLLRLSGLAVGRAGPLSSSTIALLAQALSRWLLHSGDVFEDGCDEAIRSSQSSVSAAGKTSRRGEGSGDESLLSSGHVVHHDRQHIAVKLKVEALSALRLLESTQSNALRAHWFSFLPDQPTAGPTLLDLISKGIPQILRIEACETLTALLKGAKAFVAIAQDSQSKASFTTLSTRLAYAVIEIHRTLGHALTAAYQQTDFALTLLRASATIATITDYRRFDTPIASFVLRSVTSCFGENECGLIEGACRTTSNVLDAVPPASKQIDPEILSSLSTNLRVHLASARESSLPALWHCAASAAAHATVSDRDVASMGLSSLERSCAPVQMAVLKFAGAYASHSRFSETWGDLRRIFQYAAEASNITVRKVCCDSLVDASSEFLQLKAPTNLLSTVALPLCCDHDASVRRAALRLMGRQANPQTEAELRTILPILQFNASDPECLIARSWTFASLADKLVGNQTTCLVDELLAEAFKYSKPDLDPSVQTNGLRALGSAMLLASKRDGLTPQIIQEAYLAWLEPLSANSIVKLQWNALATVERLADILEPPIAVKAFDRVRNLSLISTNLKVRLASIPCLLLLSRSHADYRHELKMTIPLLRNKLDTEEGTLPYAEMKHAIVLRQALNAAELSLLPAVTEEVSP